MTTEEVDEMESGEQMQFRSAPAWATLLAVFLLLILLSVLVFSSKKNGIELRQEIYQVREQEMRSGTVVDKLGNEKISQETTIKLRNGRGGDVLFVSVNPIPPDVFFVRPVQLSNGAVILLPVRSLAEEQAATEKNGEK